MQSLVKAVLDKAESQLGVEEHPRGSNNGPEVRAYLKATGLGPGAPWCAAFIAWCVQQVEKAHDTTIALPKTASCDVLLTFARRHEILFTDPQPGDVFLVLASANDATHTGLVTSVSDSGFTTIEGNSNSSGSREGYAVVSNTRPFKTRFRFVRWGSLLPAEHDDLTPDPIPAPTLTYDLYLSGNKIAVMEVTNGVARVDAELWCKKLGVKFGWDSDNHCVLIDGRPVPATPLLKNKKVYLPVRVLADFSGLVLTLDAANRKVLVTK